MSLDRATLEYIAAPMVNQSDLPFRILVRRYGATLVYTQMLSPQRLLEDRDYLDFHLRELGDENDRPVVVQLCGNNPDTLIRGARKLVHRCDGIDLNFGCPQEHAQEGHYGGYLLGQRDWPLVQNLISSMSASLSVPVSAKIRLTPDPSLTPVLAERLATSGASWITLHARTVSARRRRHGAADLSWVKAVREAVDPRVPVISNGNVRTFEDMGRNKAETGADGLMVGETLLGNPCLFANVVPDPVRISLEYLAICREHPDTVTIQIAQMHVRHFVEFQWYVSSNMLLNVI
ncbi:FMN-linked oxidoreductase [Punctularia strigosozonata HHB-11173 SS5]|uniref:FMN-linked oxidoreductase n=1 Tax=Punctularia strigosozonata (strain HHB-11173) TaxID=741275 RepID=UPI0004416E41|nr:FMN-linked oxidoreductase [Punctularia strigosozonata HHB-11173 SS5]EIN08317.1 FMN-linked oxidoreductase [Punctularia strigosozonata HHB-11173 SS5]